MVGDVPEELSAASRGLARAHRLVVDMIVFRRIRPGEILEAAEGLDAVATSLRAWVDRLKKTIASRD